MNCETTAHSCPGKTKGKHQDTYYYVNVCKVTQLILLLLLSLYKLSYWYNTNWPLLMKRFHPNYK